MRPPTTKASPERPELDASGRLFDPLIRRGLAEFGKGTPTVAIEALTAVRLLAKQMHDQFQQWTEGHGLSESRFRVLVTIYHSPARRLPLGAIAESLNVVPRTVTDLVDVLERDGLVTRVPDAADRRSILAVLTDEGLERIAAIRRSALREQAAMTRGMTDNQLADLRHLCLLLTQNLRPPQA
jgi:DNA-binding MarR family transcriptional regulator